MTQREIALGRMLYPDDELQEIASTRPKTRGDCAGVERPCPYVACKWNLFLDVTENGNVKLNFPDIEPGEMGASCALDVADEGGATLERTGEVLNITRERVRQIDEDVLLAVKRRAGLGLADYRGHVSATSDGNYPSRTYDEGPLVPLGEPTPEEEREDHESGAVRPRLPIFGANEGGALRSAYEIFEKHRGRWAEASRSVRILVRQKEEESMDPDETETSTEKTIAPAKLARRLLRKSPDSTDLIKRMLSRRDEYLEEAERLDAAITFLEAAS